MDLFDALPARVVAQLASKRALVPRALCMGQDAAVAFARELQGLTAGRRVAVLVDLRTLRAAGDECMEALRRAGFDVLPELLEDAGGHPPVCDEVTKNRLLATLPAADAIVGVGSGVISDLAKWVAFERGVPGAIFATAASMNGYAAANVAPSVAGVKTLIHARAHRLIGADPRILAAAPFELTSAGLGDAIAKTVSSVDWKMNDRLFGEAYDPAIAGIFDHVQGRFLSDPARLAARDPDATSGLFEALVYSGCAMTLQGSSLPASGGEHLISHALDMRAMAEGVAHDLHGRQVGVGTIFAAALYQEALALPAPSFRHAALPLDVAGWGSVASSVAVHHDKQTVRFTSAVERLCRDDTWQRLRDELRPMLPDPAWLKRVLKDSGAAHRIADLGISRERFLWAVLQGAQIRERFTSLDLGWAAGVLPDAAASIADRYLMT